MTEHALGIVMLYDRSEGDPQDVSKKFSESFSDVTDALVIDQINNPGGDPEIVSELLSLLTDYPLENIKDRNAITHNDAARALDTIDMIETELNYFSNFLPNSEKLKGELKFAQFILEQWNAGNSLTSPYPLNGEKFIQPHPLFNYKKPILVIINELDLSCGY